MHICANWIFTKWWNVLVMNDVPVSVNGDGMWVSACAVAASPA